MKLGRNDPCPCGSGQKYKRCCLDLEELREQARRVVRAQRDRSLAGSEDAAEAAALAEALRMVVTKDRAAPSAALDRFASLVTTKEILTCLRFDDGADRPAVQGLRDQLVGALAAARLSPPDGEAVAAALVCLDPVLAMPELPASESPTLEIVFNHQFEAWARR